MSRCKQESCPNWAGDAGCPCAVLGIDPEGEDWMFDDSKPWGVANRLTEGTDQ